MKHRVFLFLALIALVITACQPISPTMTRPQAKTRAQTLDAEQSGNYLGAAQQYEALAAKSTGEMQAQYYLRAASMWWQIDKYSEAKKALGHIHPALLSGSQQRELAILNAKMALFNQDAESALKALENLDLSSVSARQQKQILGLKVKAYAITENWLDKATTHIALDQILADGEQRQANQQALWQSLMQLTPKALDLFNPGIPPAVDSGWFALAYIVKTYQSNPDALAVALADWNRNYPNHPADPALYKRTLSSASTSPLPQPQQVGDIAILLHDSGPYAQAARAIRQGIVAAYFTDSNNSTDDSNGRLHFYEIKSDRQTGQSDVLSQYQKAVDAGASVVVGPLDKQSVDTLAQAQSLDIPVLALNRNSLGINRSNLFQFGLAPEDDAHSVAHYASAHGYHRAVILAPATAWGDRIATAFTQRWRQYGGIILRKASYHESQNDFSNTIVPLLGLDASTQRYRTLKATVNEKIAFAPRRRQDIDFVFLIGSPLKARQLVPQLKFNRSGRLPIIVTSHAYNGQSNAQQNIDLNNVIITDVPWVFNKQASKDPAYQAIQSQLPQGMGNLIRLYALGVDAYRLLPRLNSMSQSADLEYNGATGKLHINNTGLIERDLSWAKFKQGLIRPIESAKIR